MATSPPAGNGGITYRPYSPKRPLSTASIPSTVSSGPAPAPTRSQSAAFVRPSVGGSRPAAIAPSPLAPPHVRSASLDGLPPRGQAAASRPAHDRGVSVLLPSAMPRPTSPPSRQSTSSPGPSSQPIAGPSHAPAPSQPVRAPYLAGFQPAGVWRSRTDELVSERSKRGEGRRLEDVRIGRRLDKVRERTSAGGLIVTS